MTGAEYREFVQEEFERSLERRAPEFESRMATIRILKKRCLRDARDPTIEELDAVLPPVSCTRTRRRLVLTPIQQHIIDLLHRVNWPMTRAEIQSYMRGPNESVANIQTALEELEMKGLIRPVPIRAQACGRRPNLGWEIV